MRYAATFIVGAASLCAFTDALACGAAYPGGPMVCTLEDAPSYKKQHAQEQPQARVSASYAYTSTTILFSGERRADLTRHTVFAGTELPLARGLGIRFGAGGIVAGELARHGAGTATFGPGVSGYVGVSKTLVEEKGAWPFFQLGATLSVSRVATRGPTPTDAPSFTAFDLRASATAGKSLLRGVIVPYASARAFGGPIYYRFPGADVTGTDLSKFQIAGGLAVALPSRTVDAFVEGVPLGERGVSAGLGTTF